MSSKTSLQNSDLNALEEYHQFVRNDEHDAANFNKDWKIRMSRKYYDKLFKEFACIDLKRYREGKFGLRWRTEREVLGGKGQKSCGTSKCLNFNEGELTTFELPFVYTENDETKSELVKVKLCTECSEKLMYKKNKEKEEEKQVYRQSYLQERESLKSKEDQERKKKRGEEKKQHHVKKRRIERAPVLTVPTHSSRHSGLKR